MLSKAALFAGLLVIFDLLEKAVVDKFWPHAGGSGDEINITNIQMMLSVGIVVFAALIPFFGIRELSKVIGEGPMHELLFV